LAELLGGELNAFVANGDRACFSGPDVHLKPKATTTLGMVIHELATNAVKYGALGDSGGKVRVEWQYQDQVLVLTWRESGGPPVNPPKHVGLGTDLIVRSLNYEMGGKASIDYRPDGVVVTLRIPAAKQHMTGAQENDAEKSSGG